MRLISNIIAKHEYNTFKVILNDSKLLKNTRYVSQSFNINHSRIKAVIDEFNISGCVIIKSKMNYGKY